MIPLFTFYGYAGFALILFPFTALLSRLSKVLGWGNPATIGNPPSMNGKVIVITGANTGIGKSTAKQLCAQGAHVIIGCRDESKAKEAIADIQSQLIKEGTHTKGGQVVHFALDLSDLSSIKSFAKLISSKYKRVDVLINNAGLANRGKTKYGLEQLFQVNYLGHFLLFRELTPLLQSKDSNQGVVNETVEGFAIPPVGRVVNLSSVMHHRGQGNFKASAYGNMKDVYSQIPGDKASNYSYYADSKYYMNLLTLEINRRYGICDNNEEGKETKQQKISHRRAINAVSCNPGAVHSDIWRHTAKSVMWIYELFMTMVYLTNDQGAAPSVYASYVDVTEDINAFAKMAAKGSLPDNPLMVMYYRHPLIPYLVPYYMAWSSLMLEQIGAFRGPQWCGVTLTPFANKTAQSLWEFSSQTCDELLKA